MNMYFKSHICLNIVTKVICFMVYVLHNINIDVPVLKDVQYIIIVLHEITNSYRFYSIEIVNYYIQRIFR